MAIGRTGKLFIIDFTIIAPYNTIASQDFKERHSSFLAQWQQLVRDIITNGHQIAFVSFENGVADPMLAAICEKRIGLSDRNKYNVYANLSPTAEVNKQIEEISQAEKNNTIVLVSHSKNFYHAAKKYQQVIASVHPPEAFEQLQELVKQLPKKSNQSALRAYSSVSPRNGVPEKEKGKEKPKEDLKCCVCATM